MLKQVNCTYIVFQQETGHGTEKGQGRPHIQGYVMYKQQKTLRAAQSALGLPTCHMEKRLAPKISDAIAYCQKVETRRPGCLPYEVGEKPMDSDIKRTLVDAIDLAKKKGYKRAMLDMPEVVIRYARGLKEYAHIAEGERIEHYRDVKVYYIWGDSGCGKSWWANMCYDTPANTYTTTDMPDKIWMGNYAGERTLVIEEFKGDCNPSILKCMLEGYKLEFQNKGGFVWSQWDTVILTSNNDPRACYDASINWWTVPPTAPGPFQRRFSTGGIIKAEGNYEMGTAKFDTELPIRQEQARGSVEQAYEPMPDIPAGNAGVTPDSGAAPDEPPIDLTMMGDVPGATFEPITPNTLAIFDGLQVDDFLNMD